MLFNWLSRGEFEQAKDRIKQGEEAFVQGHNAHHSLLTKEMNGELKPNRSNSDAR